MMILYSSRVLNNYDSSKCKRVRTLICWQLSSHPIKLHTGDIIYAVRLNYSRNLSDHPVMTPFEKPTASKVCRRRRRWSGWGGRNFSVNQFFCLTGREKASKIISLMKNFPNHEVYKVFPVTVLKPRHFSSIDERAVKFSRHRSLLFENKKGRNQEFDQSRKKR